MTTRELLAAHQARLRSRFPIPAIRTDATFFAGKATIDLPDKSPLTKLYKQRAAAAGVSTQGKHYFGKIADSMGDPEAWVSSRADIKRVCEKRGWGCEGPGIKVRPAVGPDEPGPYEKPYRVADDVVSEAAELRIEKDGLTDLTPKEKTRLREQVRSQITPDGGI